MQYDKKAEKEISDFYAVRMSRSVGFPLSPFGLSFNAWVQLNTSQCNYAGLESELWLNDLIGVFKIIDSIW